MELSDFESSSFEPKTWINQILKKFEKEETNEKTIKSLIIKLQVCFHQLNNEFENTSHNVIQNLPKIMKDTEKLMKEAETLKTKMSAVRDDVTRISKNTGISIASLERIDKIKTELKKAEEALHEADNWTMLSNDVKAAFETRDIDVITNKLVTMQQSLNVLTVVPDYENKESELEEFKDQLQTLIYPLLLQAFTLKAHDQCKKYVRIFQDINRQSQVSKCYCDCQRIILNQIWNEVVEVGRNESVLESFNHFYDELIVKWQDQVRCCDIIFPNIPADNILIDLYRELLTSLKPKFNECIQNYVKELQQPLPFLLELKQCTKKFANNLKALIDVRNVTNINLLNLAKAIYSPYVTYISEYGKYQQAALHHHLSSLTVVKDDMVESIQLLGQLNSKVFYLVDEANKMCLDFTEGCSYPGFFETIEWFLNLYLDQYSIITTEISKEQHKQEEVNMFQLCLTILQSLGDFVNRVKQVDEECINTIRNLEMESKPSRVHPFMNYQKLLLDEKKQTEFDALKSKVVEITDLSLLQPVLLLVGKICCDVYETTFQVIFSPMASVLNSVESFDSWKSKQFAITSELPDYSFVPQEYITQLGQYLMNLPQLLEPFLMTKNPSLTVALSMIGQEHIQLENAGEENGFAEVFLGQITKRTCKIYCNQILKICELPPMACKQLATDISYLSNVLEDLGFSLTQKLQDILLLLKLSPSEYASQSAGCSPKLVAAIRQMRNII